MTVLTPNGDFNSLLPIGEWAGRFIHRSSETVPNNAMVMSRFQLVMGRILVAKEPLSISARSAMCCESDDAVLMKLVTQCMGSLLSGVHQPDIPVRGRHSEGLMRNFDPVYCTISTVSSRILKICWPRWPIKFLLNSSDLKRGFFLWLLRVTELAVEMVQYTNIFLRTPWRLYINYGGSLPVRSYY